MPKSDGSFGERLRALLKEKGLSQVELSRRTGISEGRISAWANDKDPCPPHHYAALAAALGVNVGDLGDPDVGPRSLIQELLHEVRAHREAVEKRGATEGPPARIILVGEGKEWSSFLGRLEALEGSRAGQTRARARRGGGRTRGS